MYDFYFILDIFWFKNLYILAFEITELYPEHIISYFYMINIIVVHIKK